MEQEIRNSESSLRKRMDEGRNKYSGNWDLGLEFGNAQLLADNVLQDLREAGGECSARVANPQMLALIDSGASEHMIGRSLLTPAERATIYKVETQTFWLAQGSYTLDEAVDLWIPFVGDMVTFRVSNSTNTPMISEGKLCRDNGCSTHRAAGSDILTLTGPRGNEVEVLMDCSCGYVRFDTGLHTAAPFSQGGGGPSGSGAPPDTPTADGGGDVDPSTLVPSRAEELAESTGPPDSGDVPPPRSHMPRPQRCDSDVKLAAEDT